MKNLKELRKRKKMTQQEIASKLNITQSTYSGYESGKYEPNIDILIAISKILQVSIDNIVGNGNDFTIDLSNMHEVEQELIKHYVEVVRESSWNELMDMHNNMIEEQIYKDEHPDEVAELKEIRELENKANLAWIRKIMREQKKKQKEEQE